MIIQNFDDLATGDKKRDCLKILEAGLKAADPEDIIPRYVTPNAIRIGDDIVDVTRYSNVYSVAFGKAGDSMTRALNAVIPVKSGIVVIPKGSRSRIKGKKFKIFNSGHPTPDRTSVKAAKEIIKFVHNRRDDELVVFLVSGGGSSLVALPFEITLDDKIYVTNLLLKSGMTIQEFNCIRKHLSKIKGGKLVEDMRCQAVGLLLSDVQGDDLSSIASGTTYMDDTTSADALNIVAKYDITRRMPLNVLEILRRESQKKDVIKPRIKNYVIANNMDCLTAMQEAARSMGYVVDVMQVFGDIKVAVTEILKNMPDKPGSCLVFGGEPTVKVMGKGVGGRNQELVLRLLKNTRRSKKVVIASMGTDGIDGNSVFAGAITENVGCDLVTMKEFLKNSDSGRFFQKRKANIVTGFTHTNLLDIGIILR